MANDSPVFLTDERRAVLKGDYDGKDSTERAHRSNIRERSRTALEELAEVADSPYIDTTEVFTADLMADLFRSIFKPDPQHLDSGGLVYDERSEVPDHPANADRSDDFLRYCDGLYVALDKPFHEYRDSRFPDPNE